MLQIEFTASEAAELRGPLDEVDPIHTCREIGPPKGILPGATRDNLGTTHAWGHDCQCTGARDEDGKVHIPQRTCYDVLDTTGLGLSVATAEKVLGAAGELPDSNRQYGLTYKFREYGKGNAP